MKKFLMAGIAFSLAPVIAAAAQTTSAAIAKPEREVHDLTIISKGSPAAELTFGKEYRYAGGQVVNLYGVADAEQHIFVKADANGAVERFYWVQFEHFLPSNTSTYKYHSDRTTDIGGLSFIYDVKSWPDYAALQVDEPASDGAAIVQLLAKSDLVFPKRAARVRMFYLPTPDRRSELMIIYGEALPEGSSVPVGPKGVDLDKDSPDSARKMLEDARKDVVIRQR